MRLRFCGRFPHAIRWIGLENRMRAAWSAHARLHSAIGIQRGNIRLRKNEQEEWSSCGAYWTCTIVEDGGNRYWTNRFYNMESNCLWSDGRCNSNFLLIVNFNEWVFCKQHIWVICTQ
jgi:hypothetical protein